MKIRQLTDAEFPKALTEIPQPPKTLWVLGELPDPELIHLSVVGSRKFTSYGKEVCEKIISTLKGYPIVIVSGFAMGIDTIAHECAMRNNLPTMIFPGSGLSEEVIFPRTNRHAVEKIINSGGCLISEFPPDLKAAYWTFPMRNRLMAGISKAILIIEAEERSGTLITARLAVEYNKDVLAVPGNIFSPNAKGTNKLLRQGATPITCPEDVLEALGFEVERTQKTLFTELSKDEEKVITLLREPMPRDELIRELGLPVTKANSILSAMEIKNLIKEEFGELRLN